MDNNIEALNLMSKLGITSYTQRHLNIVLHFLKNGSENAEELLDNLGDWDEKDLKISKNFF